MFFTTERVVAGLFFVLLVGAACFSLERILFADASFILFRIVNSGDLQIQEHRFGSFITQLFPLVAARLRLSLQAIVLLYSLSFNLFYLAVSLLLLYRFRQTELAVLMAFYFVLFVSDTWFWVNNEVHQGIAWMFLFFATLIDLGKRKAPLVVALPVFTLLAFLTIYTHPLLTLPTAYLWLFFVTKEGWPYPRSTTIVFSIVLIAMAVSKFLLSTSASSHYDTGKLEGIMQLNAEKWSAAFRSKLPAAILKNTVWNYWLTPVLSVTGLVAAWQRKAHWHLLLTVGFGAFYLIALCLTFRDFIPFYTESELMPASIVLTTPFVYYTLAFLKPKKKAFLLAIIVLIRLAYIGIAVPRWVERKEWLSATLESMRRQNLTKAFIYENNLNKKALFQTWGTPVESLLLSALQGEHSQRTFVVDKPENFPSRIPQDSTLMIASFEWLRNSSLNKNYFTFDTTRHYQLLH